MSSSEQVFDYESVTPQAGRRLEGGASEPEDAAAVGLSNAGTRGLTHEGDATDSATADASTGTTTARQKNPFALRRGHSLTYFALFVFTVFLYVRPYEFIPALEPLSEFAFPLGVCTLLIFLPSQLALEGSLTARPREVVLVGLLAAAGLLSIPLAVNPAEAWGSFTAVFIKAVVMFVVLVNVVRTERRLRQLILIAAVAGCILSFGALNDYLSGHFTVEGYRVKGSLRGWMDNTNDMAIHFVMMVPVLVALTFTTRNPLRKVVYLAGAGLMVAGMVVTFSRGAFLGLACAGATFAYKLARRHRAASVLLIGAFLVAFLVLAPSNYSDRLISIVDHSRDPNGSASMRSAVLLSSLWVALRHPVLGVGMGNFHIFSIRELVSHNAYTQVAAEMGVAALVVYVMFLVSPLRRLRQVERETFAERRGSRFYYLAVGLQAALVAYMVSSFFASVAYLWFAYYFVGFSVCLRRMYEAETGRKVLTAGELKRREKKLKARAGRETRQDASHAEAEALTHA